MNASRVFIDTLQLKFAATPGNVGILLLITLALILAGLSLLRHRRNRLRAIFLTATRVLAVGAVLFLLCQPVLEMQLRTEWKNRLLVIADDSASMTLPAETGGRERRIDRSNRFVRQLKEHVSERWQQRILTLGTDLIPWQEKEPRGGLTDLGRGLLDDDSGRFTPDAILLLSDGRVTRGAPLATIAGRLKVPVFSWPCGEEISLRDVAVASVSAPAEAHVGEDVLVHGRLLRRGIAESRLTVRLLDDSNRVVAQQLVDFAPQSDEIDVVFHWTPDEEGETFLRLEIPRLPDEAVEGNNIRRVALTVKGKPQPVLLLSSSPRFDSQVLRRHFDNRRGLQLTSVVVDGSVIRDDRSFQPLEIKDFRLCVLDNPDLSRWPGSLIAKIAAGIRDGAGLLLVCGRDTNWSGSGLEDFIPVADGPYLDGAVEMKLTDQGSIHPITRLSLSPALNPLIFSDMPRLSGRLQVKESKPGALVLLKEPQSNEPLLVCSRAGDGKVAVLLADGISRALFRPRLFARNSRHFGELLDRLGGWLLTRGEDGFRLRMDRSVLEAGDEIHVFIDRPSGEECRLRMISPQGGNLFDQVYPPAGTADMVRETMIPREAGEYQLEAISSGSTLTRRLFVEPPASEFNELQPDMTELLRLCRVTGGHLLESADASALVNLLPDQNRIERRNVRLPLHGLPAAAMILIALLTLEWGVRRLWQLD